MFGKMPNLEYFDPLSLRLYLIEVNFLAIFGDGEKYLQNFILIKERKLWLQQKL